MSRMTRVRPVSTSHRHRGNGLAIRRSGWARGIVALSRQVTVTLDADTFERLKPGAARKIRHIVEEAVRSEVNIR